jgi:hypothetical protein
MKVLKSVDYMTFSILDKYANILKAKKLTLDTFTYNQLISKRTESGQESTIILSIES